MQFAGDFYNSNNLYYRSTNGNGRTGWNKMLHSGNFNDYTPTLTGIGATGTWSINITGNVTGNVTGDLTGSVYAQGKRIFAGDGTATSPSIAFGYDVGQDTGFYHESDGYINITNNGLYSGQFQPNGHLAMQGNISVGQNGRFFGNLIGNASTATNSTYSDYAYFVNIGTNHADQTGIYTKFNLDQFNTDQPRLVWGTNDIQDSFLWDPSNFNVKTAVTSGAITNRGNITAEVNGQGEPNNALTLRSVYNNGYPTTYGNVITLGGGGGGELLIGWSGSTGSHADNYIRSRRDVANVWSPWAKILTDANFSNTLSSVASSGSYTDLKDKPNIPNPVIIAQTLNNNLQNIVETIVGSIDMHTYGYSDSQGGIINGPANGWTTSYYNFVYGNVTNGSISVSINLADYLQLSRNPSDINWRGNYDLNIQSAITSIYDARQIAYGLYPVTWSVQTRNYTTNRNDYYYGLFVITLSTSGDHYYHGTSVEASWIGIGSRTRNVYTP